MIYLSYGSVWSWDLISRDYKLFKSITTHVCKEKHVGEVVDHRYHYSLVYKLYSFNTKSWKKIKTPEAAMMYPYVVYLWGSCTRLQSLIPDCGSDSKEDDPFRHHIIAFDIATEILTHLSFP